VKTLRGFPFQGLYAITDRALCGDHLTERVAQAIAGGARVIQYRDKTRDHARRRAEAEALLALCRAHGVPLLINDDVALASTIGADGVHIGREDGALADARAALGPQAIIGVSCYDRLGLAEQAVASGADYVAFGRFFPSRSKPQAVQAPLELLHRARRELPCPVVAIGGITAQNGQPLIEAGADLLAVIAGVFDHPDVAATARRISQLFQTHSEITA